MKRIAAFLAALLMIAAGTSFARAESVKIYKIGYCVDLQDEAFTPAFLEGFEGSFANRSGDSNRYELFPIDLGGDAESLQRHLRFLMDQGVDVIVMRPPMMEATSSLISLVADAGVPLVVVNQEPLRYDLEKYHADVADERITDYDKVCYVCADPRQTGIRQGMVVRQLPGVDVNQDGWAAYVLLEGPLTSAKDRITTYYAEQMMSSMVTDALRLAYATTDGTQENAQTVLTNTLRQYDYLDLVLCNTDEIALGAVKALEAAGRTVGQDVFVVGCGGTEEALALLQTGELTGTVRMNITALGRQAAEAAVRLVQGMTVEPYYFSDYEAVSAAAE